MRPELVVEQQASKNNYEDQCLSSHCPYHSSLWLRAMGYLLQSLTTLTFSPTLDTFTHRNPVQHTEHTQQESHASTSEKLSKIINQSLPLEERKQPVTADSQRRSKEDGLKHNKELKE